MRIVANNKTNRHENEVIFDIFDTSMTLAVTIVLHDLSIRNSS